MARPITAEYIQRDQLMVKRYVEEERTLADLNEEFGLSKVRLRAILEGQGVELRSEPRPKLVERRPKHPMLTAMGARLHHYRMTHQLTLPQMAIQIGLPETKLSEALQGLHNWQFNEIVRATELLGMDLHKFIKPAGGANG
jgi:hypothetical protein